MLGQTIEYRDSETIPETNPEEQIRQTARFLPRRHSFLEIRNGHTEHYAKVCRRDGQVSEIQDAVHD